MAENGEVIRLIENLSASLQSEMGELRAEMRRQISDMRAAVNSKLDQIVETGKRHSALFTADALAVRGMERTVMNHDLAIAELKKRVAELELGRGQPPSA